MNVLTCISKTFIHSKLQSGNNGATRMIAAHFIYLLFFYVKHLSQTDLNKLLSPVRGFIALDTSFIILYLLNYSDTNVTPLLLSTRISPSLVICGWPNFCHYPL